MLEYAVYRHTIMLMCEKSKASITNMSWVIGINIAKKEHIWLTHDHYMRYKPTYLLI